MNVNLKHSGLYSSLLFIRFSLIFQKKIFGGGGGEQKRALVFCRKTLKKYDIKKTNSWSETYLTYLTVSRP